MNTLKACKRDLSVKAKKLRREGLVTGSIFGRDLEGAIAIQMDKKDVDRVLKTQNKGSQVVIDIDGDKKLCLIKELQFNTLKGAVTEMDLQALNENEEVRSSAEIILVEVEFRALPKNLVDRIKIDMKQYKVGDNIKVSDLEIAKNPEIHLLTPADELVVSVSEIHSKGEAAPAAEETAAE